MSDRHWLPQQAGRDCSLQVVDQKAIEAVSERLRDIKRSVRRDTAVHLMAVFRLAAYIACGLDSP